MNLEPELALAKDVRRVIKGLFGRLQPHALIWKDVTVGTSRSLVQMPSNVDTILDELAPILSEGMSDARVDHMGTAGYGWEVIGPGSVSRSPGSDSV